MAVDPSDLLDPPYGFGECSEKEVRVQAHCECFKEPDCDVTIKVRKQGDWISIDIPSILHEVDSEKDVDYATLKIDSFLPDDYLDDTPRRRVFGCLAQAFDLNNNTLKIVPAVVVMEKSGEITINPGIKCESMGTAGNVETVTDNYFFTSSGNEGSIGTLSMNLTYEMDDFEEYKSLDDIIFKREESEDPLP